MTIFEAGALRERLATQILELEGWRQSRFVAELFAADPRAEQHQTFAIGLPTGTPDSDVESSRTRRGPLGALTKMRVLVRWAYRLRADNQVEDYQSALDAETALRVKVLGIPRADGVHLAWSDSSRRVVPGGDLLIGDLLFDATHRVSIQ